MDGQQMKVNNCCCVVSYTNSKELISTYVIVFEDG